MVLGSLSFVLGATFHLNRVMFPGRAKDKEQRTACAISGGCLCGCGAFRGNLQSRISEEHKTMLKQLRNLKHTRNFVIIGFIDFMAASLVFFYKPGGSGSSVEPTRNMDVVARVNGDEITVADLAQLKENYRQMFGDQMLAQPGSNQR